MFKLIEIQPLLKDMGRNKVKIDKFQFEYNKVTFDVIILIDRSPFELLFGIIGYNYCFELKLDVGYQLQEIPNTVFFKLCEILDLKPGKESFNSYKFLKYFAKKIPKNYSKKLIQPHEVAKYKCKNIPEADKIYFCGWKIFAGTTKNAKNFEKTKKILGDDAYNFCKKHNISSCWTNVEIKRKDYVKPNEYYESLKKSV